MHEPGALVRVTLSDSKDEKLGMVIARSSWCVSVDPRVPDVLHRRIGYKVLIDGAIENIEDRFMAEIVSKKTLDI